MPRLRLRWAWRALTSLWQKFATAELEKHYTARIKNRQQATSGAFVARSEPFIVPFIPVMPGLVGDDFEVARGAPTTMLDHILFL